MREKIKNIIQLFMLSVLVGAGSALGIAIATVILSIF